MEEARSRRRRNAAFIARLLAFLLIFSMLCAIALYVLIPKADYGPGSMINAYMQPENSVDVLAIGTSMTYAGLNTNVLWANWGIASYNLASAEQQYWNTYYYLEEFLKLQRPKLILLDAKAATYLKSETKRGRVILSTYGILSPLTRFRAIQAAAPEGKAFDYMLAFPQVHENWKTINAENFAVPGWTGGRSTDWKGFVEKDETEQHSKPSLVWTQTRKDMNEREIEWFHKICDLAKAYDIPILLVAYPNPDYANDHMYYNTLWGLADEKNIPHINFNDPEGHFRFLYSTEFADWQHVNILGSLKLTKIMGRVLDDCYDLTDHRGDPAYASYDRCLSEWKEKYPQYAEKLYLEE